MMKSGKTYALSAALLLASAVPQALVAQTPQPSASEQQARAAEKARLDALERSLNPQTGTIAIPEAHANLQLGAAYYFLPADDAKRVLTEAWGNPPDSVGHVLGLVFPTGKTFHDATWGAVVEYENTGHISDKDAASQDYDSVLAKMKSATEEENKETVRSGYPAQHLVGWAQAPTYDSATKTLIWARDIQFEGAPQDTLNYDVRTLGRTGVLSLNMVDSMPNLGAVQKAAKGLGSTVHFDAAENYAAFNPKTDKLADYGLAGLVAAGAGLLVAKKVGLLAVVLLFAKKAIALLVAGAFAGWRWFKRKVGRNAEEQYEAEPEEQLPAAE